MSRRPQPPPPVEFEPLIGRFIHEAHRPRANEALQSLQRIASIVKPIMRTRNWYVSTLTEFYPTDPRLLGLNIRRGADIEIRLRLRHPGDANQFVPFEQVVDTMLHELSHIVHGAHDQKFYALWDQLRDEHEALLRKGYTGEGFLGQGSRLGGSGRIPMHEARRKARAAAEKRRTMTAGSGQRLGGWAPPPRSAQEARDRIVAAVERRKIIERGCGTGTQDEEQMEVATRPDRKNAVSTKAAKIDVDEETMMKAFIDLIQEEERGIHGDSYIPPSQENPSGMRTIGPPLSPHTLRAQQASIEAELTQGKSSTKSESTTPFPRSETNPTPTPPPHSSRPPAPSPPPEPQPETWPCPTCTLVNHLALPYCEACEGPRPSELAPSTSPPPQPPSSSRGAAASASTEKDLPNALKPRLKSSDAWSRIKAQEEARNQAAAAAWGCHACGMYNEQMWWSCQACGVVKLSS